ncbi:MAG TPA: type 4a pilus biogenesis protein PilO [Actinomycetota bacterium]|nr:type 4a pilus biogenesis protein PilO [Actinomycetota bacterium]
MNARSRMILAIVGAAIVCLLFFFLFIRSRQGELATVRTNIENEENLALQLTTELNRLKDLQARAPELQAELARIRELVPQEHEVPHFIFLVQDAATESGVTFLEITPTLPQTPPEQAPLAEVSMAIGAQGSYFSIQDFIRRLHELDRATRIDNLNMSREDAGSDAIGLTLQARIFFELPSAPTAGEQPEANVPPPTEPVGSVSPTPAAPAESPAPAETP